MKKILLSLSMIAVIAVVVAGATGAFFSDTETSTGNTFTAGAIDLTIDNESYITNTSGTLVASPSTSWSLADLTNQLFFNFSDLKPGDVGEDTISLHVNSNDAWACMAIDLTSTPENGQTEPELAVPDTTIGTNDGELQNELKFVFWNDDGDNVYEVGESAFWQNQTIAQISAAGTVALADSSGTGVLGSTPLTGNSTRYIGKAWCFGDMTLTPVTQDGQGKTGSNGPLARGTGITCSGASATNITQTDGIVADVSFRAEQSRNNAGFLCSTPTPGPQGPTVGSNFSSYSAPTCNVTVDGNGTNPALDTIQEGVAAATTGQTVCVADGTYTGPIEVNKNVTLASVNGPSVTTINGGVKITSSDVTVKGFTINTGIVSGEPNPVGFYVASGSNILINSNDIDGNSVALSTGILFVTGATYTNVDVTNNDIHHNNAGIYTNPHTGTLAINDNDIFDNNAGIGGLMGATVTNNEFTHTIASSEAIGIDSTFDSNVATANFNNFLSGVQLNDYGATAVMDAQDNFFNLGSAAQIDAGQFDASSEEGAAYAHN